ncbi:MAG: hypothetical protein K8Q89_05130 [Nitrosarchaeum sp.]|nr:hypothetical protein [Nitrosarchaeum sp.]
MKSRLLILGIGMLVFGFANMFRYMSISLSLVNQPFPFEHLHNVIPSDGRGTHFEIDYLPIETAVNDPYWLFWSLVLYAGIAVVVFGIWRKRK